MSNVENILKNTLDGATEFRAPNSRVEQLLVELKDRINTSGGGTGSGYDDTEIRQLISDLSDELGLRIVNVATNDKELKIKNDGGAYILLGESGTFYLSSKTGEANMYSDTNNWISIKGKNRVDLKVNDESGNTITRIKMTDKIEVTTTDDKPLLLNGKEVATKDDTSSKGFVYIDSISSDDWEFIENSIHDDALTYGIKKNINVSGYDFILFYGYDDNQVSTDQLIINVEHAIHFDYTLRSNINENNKITIYTINNEADLYISAVIPDDNGIDGPMHTNYFVYGIKF